jgi:hypothetical protein
MQEDPKGCKMKYEDVDPKSPIEMDFGPDNPNWQGEPELNQTFLSVALAYMGDKLHHNGYLFVNDVLDHLGFERIPEGQLVGWMNTRNKPREIWTTISSNESPSITIKLKPDGFIWHRI